MFAIVAPPVSNPVKVALLIVVLLVRAKSSADSISNLPGLSGLVAVAMRLVTLPVLKKKGVADAGMASKANTASATCLIAEWLANALSMVVSWSWSLQRVCNNYAGPHLPQKISWLAPTTGPPSTQPVRAL